MVHVGDAGLPPPENKIYYPALDGLRAVAVLMVFVHHYFNFVRTLAWGWAGVDIFFVLSGFLITGILYDTRDASNRIRTFYARRTLRIFPLYYAVLIAGFSLNSVFHWAWNPAWYLWPLYLGNYIRFIYLPLFLQQPGILEHLKSTLDFREPFFLYFGHLWSLCVEEQFYLIWPVVVFIVRDRIRLRNICLASVVVCLALRIACLYVIPSSYLDAQLFYRFTPLRVDALLLGGFLALTLRDVAEGAFLKRLAMPIACSCIVGFMLFETIYRLISHHAYEPNIAGPVLSTIGFTLIDIFAACLILLSLNSKGYLYKVLNIKPLKRLGALSYGFYVFHDIPRRAYVILVNRYLPRVSHPSIPIAIIAFAGTLLLSSLSFYLFESQFLRLKKYFV